MAINLSLTEDAAYKSRAEFNVFSPVSFNKKRIKLYRAESRIESKMFLAIFLQQNEDPTSLVRVQSRRSFIAKQVTWYNELGVHIVEISTRFEHGKYFLL